MIELKENSSFYKSHIEDVLPMNIVDAERVIFDNIPLDYGFNIYEAIFIGFIVIFPIIIIVFINKKLK